MQPTSGMTYASTGVDYEAMDPFKRQAQLAARETDEYLTRFGFSAVSWTRGESVFLIETPWGYLAFVVECLGTKNLVADAFRLALDIEEQTGKTYYDNVAECNAAMAFNDLITLGASPLAYGQYLAVGESKWFDDEKRRSDLIAGTKRACMIARCAWSGGETPTLNGIIFPGKADLAGATMGIIPNKSRLINPATLKHGDVMILIRSSGLHTNGYTMARKIADKLPGHYLTELSDGRTYGEALLDPTYIYAELVEACLDCGVDIHYTVNVTGHSFRKLMRAVQPFTYVVEHLPPSMPIFDFIQKHGPVSDEEAFATLNMGVGFALFVPENDVEKVLALDRRAFVGGHIESGDKKVIIKPKGLEYLGKTLGVR